MIRLWWRFSPIAALLASAALAETAGGIAGKIVDPAGAPVSGAMVTAAGEALQGERSARTGASGEFDLPELPPGRYLLTVQADGYQAFSREDLESHLDRTLFLRLTMIPEGSSGAAIPDRGERPSMHAPDMGSGGIVSREEMEILPWGRETRGFEQALVAIPGVLRDPRGLRVPGAQPEQIRYFVDGLDLTDPVAPALGTRLTQRFFEEASLLEGVTAAEIGWSSGAVVHAVTRSGGNALHGSVFTDAQPFEASRRQPGEALDWALQPGFELGGPLQRDHLWMYAGFAPQLISTGPGTRTDLEYVGKLTWRPTEGHSLALSALGDPGTGAGSNDLSLRYLGVLPAVALEAGAGWHHARDGADRVAGSLTAGTFLELAGHHRLKVGGDLARESTGALNQTLAAGFVQDSWSVLDAVQLDAGLRFEAQGGRSDRSALLPRAGLSWDFTGRGLAKLYAAYGRFDQPVPLGWPTPASGETQDLFSSGLRYQVHRDIVASVDYAHREDRTRYDGVTLAVGKQLSRNYLFHASYTFSSWRGDAAAVAGGAPSIFGLDAAYAFEWTPALTVSLGAAGRAANRAAWEVNLDLRAMARYALTPSYQLSVNLDVLNALDRQADPSQPPLAVRLGAALSF